MIDSPVFLKSKKGDIVYRSTPTIPQKRFQRKKGSNEIEIGLNSLDFYNTLTKGTEISKEEYYSF